MHLKRTKLIEMRFLAYAVAFMAGTWLYAMACWHVPWLNW